tara:strand:- start:12886 stop:13695 length:810 start_codon:yes stop_codon:yes gene_type:complete
MKSLTRNIFIVKSSKNIITNRMRPSACQPLSGTNRFISGQIKEAKIYIDPFNCIMRESDCHIKALTYFTGTALLILALGIRGTAHAQNTDPQSSDTAIATFAGGCFWCMEPPYDELDGVISTTSGYIGGSVKDLSYEQVLTGRTGHAEAVQIEYDPSQISYERLLEVFWRNIDPLDAGGQFCDRGSQYRSAIFYHNDQQKQLAEASREKLNTQAGLPGPIVTEIVAADIDDFYRAEDYHQNYYQENPIRYKFYRWNCGRDARLEELWGE